MKKSNKIYLQDTQESMAIIKDTLKEAFTLYNDHRNLSERHYIKIEFDTGAFIIIKMFSPTNEFENQIGILSTNDDRYKSEICVASFVYSPDVDTLVDDIFSTHLGFMRYLEHTCVEIKHNFDEPDPKRKYAEISIKGDTLKEAMDNWIVYIIQSLGYGKRTICSGAWNINIGSPEQTKIKFSLMVEMHNINGLECFYCEGIQNMEKESDILNDEGLRDYLYSFADYVKKLVSYTLPNKKETVVIKFYAEEE